MTANLLKLNDDKYEIIVINKRNDILDHLPNLKVGDANLPPSCSAKNCSSIFDTAMGVTVHINATYKSTFCEIRNTVRILPLLNDKVAAFLVHVFISSLTGLSMTISPQFWPPCTGFLSTRE